MPASVVELTTPPDHVRQAVAQAAGRQRLRAALQVGFFLLFALAPVFNLFRFDLTEGHAYILGMPWRLGLDEFIAGRISGAQAGLNLLLRLFLPLLAAAGLFIAAAWRWGRLYCGWLCPHFSAVELINGLMRRASGKLSIWEKKPLPPVNPDGSAFTSSPWWWPPTLLTAIAFAFLWAVVLLSYLLPPAELYGHLLSLAPTRNEALFLGAATTVLSCEFLFARHLFCRFGCAVGLFQSLAWMSNRSAMVVGFERPRAADCEACYASGGPGYAACEGACPMRLKPRSQKRKMFACTQCSQCVEACGTVQQSVGKTSLLRWVDKDAARANEALVSLTGKRD